LCLEHVREHLGTLLRTADYFQDQLPRCAFRRKTNLHGRLRPGGRNNAKQHYQHDGVDFRHL
jgi:hypothetical protein